jgi:BNR repeat-like domain
MIRAIGLLVLLLSPQRQPVKPCADCARPITVVAGPSPFQPSCIGQQIGTNYPGAPAEPWITVDPGNPKHLVGAWQQDRWSTGGSSGVLTGASFDGGNTWKISSAPFSTCTGGTYDRASDPWVTFSPDGTVYQTALVVSQCNAQSECNESSVLVAQSTDGGVTWGSPGGLPYRVVDPGTRGFDDKESITADPTNNLYAYVVWDRSSGSTSNSTYHQPVYFSRTTDGGNSWTTPQAIFDLGVNLGATGNQIAVLPNGTVVDLFTAGRIVDGQPQQYLGVVRSIDHGATWSNQSVVSNQEVNGIMDVKTGAIIRVGAALASIAVDPASGTVYVAWEDSRFSNNQRDGIALSKSTDGGVTWSAPVQVNQAPTVQAFEPAITVGAGGAIAIDYFDFRQDTSDASVLLTSSWRIVSNNGGNTWQEFPLLPAFNMLNAPALANYFVGDYHSIVAVPGGFTSILVIANAPGSPSENSVMSVISAFPGDTRTTASPQVNPHRYTPRLHERPPRPH